MQYEVTQAHSSCESAAFGTFPLLRKGSFLETDRRAAA